MSNIAVDPGTSIRRLHHMHESNMERDVKGAAREMRINKRVTPHILCHTFVTQLLMDGSDIRTLQASLGYKVYQLP